jgi:hypothetical protein
MKMCLTPPVAARGAWLIAGRSAAGAVLLAVTVSACSGGSASSTPSIFTPTAPTSGQASSTSGTRTPSPSGGASTSAKASSAGASASRSPVTSAARPPAAAAPTVTKTVVVTQTPLVTYTTRYPAAAPETGGGGTAGLQDGLLFGVGGAAVLVGLGSLAYRRRVSRKLADPRRPAPRDPAAREPADR